MLTLTKGGTIDNIYGYDYNNAYIGSAGGGKVGQGGVLELTIDQKVAGVEADYVAVSNTDIGTCIAWISVKQYDGQSSGSWNGDVGYNCGQHWYYGNQKAGKLPDGSDWRPYCAWLDGNHDQNRPSAALKFKVSAYGDHVKDTLKNDEACSATIFQYDEGKVDGKPSGKRTIHKVATSPPARYPWMESVLIHSNITQHDAEHMCNHPKSYGPDFVDSNGMYCDMDTKTLTPVCTSDTDDKCMHLNHDTKTVTKRSFGVKRTDEALHKTFESIDYWQE